MEDFRWHFLLTGILIVAAVRLIAYFKRQSQDSGEIRFGISEFVKLRDRVPKPPSLWRRFRFWLTRRFSSREAAQYEYRDRIRLDHWAVEMLFFCPRLPLTVTLQVDSVKEPTIATISVDHGDGYQPAYFAWKVTSLGNSHIYTIWLYLEKSVNSVAISLEHTDDEFQYRCGSVFAVLAYEDYPTLRDGYTYLAQGSAEGAMRYFEKYERFSKENPWVCMAQADYYVGRKEWRLVANYALLAAVHGHSRTGIDYYGFARENHGFETTPETIELLLKREEEWALDPQIGFSVLQEANEVTCGLNGYHLNRRHQIFRVRRAAAARFLRKVSFDFSTSDDTILHSALRVIRASGEIVKAGNESFIYADSDSRNPAITTEEEKQALWMLPNLYVGDVVEWTSDVLVRDRHTKEKPSPFEMISLFSNAYPTLAAKIDVLARSGIEPVFHHTHPEQVTTSNEDSQDGTRCYSFAGEKYIPARNLGFDYGDLFLNPRIGFTQRSVNWKAVAESIGETLLGKRSHEDKLPGEVKALYADCEDVLSKLEVVFYWIRDTLKYGVFQRAHAMIGKADRAQAIVKSGFADCKDRSYLLHLLCNELGVESEFYMTTSKLGSAIEELPADQFDHVSVRAKVDDKWLYLDPTNSNCLFGSVPHWYQGMKSLILDDSGSMITLPEDKPRDNSLVIREVYNRIDDGWVAGSFFIRSRGQTARLFEEHWKARSLSSDRRLVAAQQAIGAFISGAVLDRFDQLASTSDSDTFTVSGMCRRVRCNDVGGQRVAAIEWNMPVLPLDAWRGFNLGKMFGFNYPMSIEIDIEFDESLARSLRDHSRSESLRTSELEISEYCEQRGDAKAIHRTININHKFIHGESLATELPLFFEGLEKALSLTCVFEK